MNADTHNKKYILTNIPLISEAISLKPDELILDLVNRKPFKDYVEQLTPYIKALENGDEWYDNVALLHLLREEQDNINLNIREKNMPKQDSVTNSNSVCDALVSNQELILTTSQSLSIGIAIGILIGIAVGKIYTKSKNPIQKVSSFRYYLLLIIPSNQAMSLKNGQILNKDDASKLINHAKRAYCFKEHDVTGQKIADNVKCSDEPIDYKTENSVLVYLVLSSSYKDIVTQRIRSNISDQISNNSEIKIKKIAKLQSALSTKDFYDI
ncbi:hypothetical protein [Methylobacter psychrophilus]|uniref:hypothetical protein n=1 Tax=Methylobacter psychrophilus TaxID=96941 RepID=UPI0021D4DE30|nr:hypothetical protein [Methylobacter psychrophilus]